MPKKLVEYIFRYDEEDYKTLKQYADPLFDDIEREMQSRTEDAQMDFLMDLSFFQEALPDEDHNRKVISDYIVNYLIPLDTDGNLKKDEFEKRMMKLEERKLHRIYIPEGEFSLAHKGEHSDAWIAQTIGASKAGLVELAFKNVQSVIPRIDNVIAAAYDGISCGTVIRNLSGDNLKKLLDSMSEEERKIADEGLCYIRTLNGHEYTPEEKEAQKALQAKEEAAGELPELEHNEANRIEYTKGCAVVRYEFCQDMNLNFITNPRVYENIQHGVLTETKRFLGEDWTSERHQDRIMNTLSNQLADFSFQIFSDRVNGYRIFDSKEFNTIKDDLKLLQNDLKKGNNLHNLKRINASLETFSKHCQDYLDKNPGTRFHERGNLRKTIVQNLKEVLDEQRQALNKHLGQEIKEKDSEWINVTKTEDLDKVKIRLSYADLEGNKKDLKNNFPKNPNPEKENVKKGPEM